jgi:arginase
LLDARPETPPMTPTRTLDVALVGAGLELGSSARGAAMGPQALRTAGLVRALAELGHRVVDYGTLHEVAPEPVAMDPAHARRCNHLEAIAGWTRAIHDRAHALASQPGVPLFLGGDHAISLGTITGVARARAGQGRPMAVLWIDAHADYNTPETTPSGNLHGMVLSLATGDPTLAPILGDRPLVPLDPGDVTVFGARSIDPAEKLRLQAHGLDAVDMRAIDERGVSALLAERIERWRARGAALHVSFDLDFLDPSVAPGTGTVVPGGGTYREAHLIMEMLCDAGIVASVDVVELNPFLDERGRSALVATELVASLFGRTVLDRAPGAVSAA